MNKHNYIPFLSRFFSSIVLSGLMVMPFSYAGGREDVGRNMAAIKEDLRYRPAGSTVAFEENKGQVIGADAAQVRYLYRQGALTIFLKNNSITYQFEQVHDTVGMSRRSSDVQPDDLQRERMVRQEQSIIRRETYRMDLQLVGANPNPVITASGKSLDYNHYYAYDAFRVHNYEKITYKDVWPQIDWVVYAGPEQVKYEFVVRPGGDPDRIRLRPDAVEDLKLLADGSLQLINRMGYVAEEPPVSFQEGQSVPSNFIINNAGEIAFELGAYDSSRELVIDPTLEWATYQGGASGDMGVFLSGSCVAVDPRDGAVYIVGETYSTTQIAALGYQNVFTSHSNTAWLAKFNAMGVRLWGTYYGTPNSVTYGRSCAVDSLSGAVYLAGNVRTETYDPAATITIALRGHQQAPGSTGSNFDAFLVRFDANGNREWGTYYGGAGYEDAWACATDQNGNVFLTGGTSSTSAIAAGGHRNSLPNTVNLLSAFLVKFNANGVRQWGTYYGGHENATGFGCAVDRRNGDVYMSGTTYGASTASDIGFNGFRNTFAGLTDDFLVKFNAAGVRQWGTFYGGSANENLATCSVDEHGDVYMTGYTWSNTGIASNGHQNTYGGSGDGYLVRFNAQGQRQWATYTGFQQRDYMRSSAVMDGSVYVCGDLTAAGSQTDMFLSQYECATGNRLFHYVHAAPANERGDYLAVDRRSQTIYVGGYTESSSGIATPGAHQVVFGGVSDAYLMKFGNCTGVRRGTDTLRVCAGYFPLSWNGRAVTGGGVAVDSFRTRTVDGICDSVAVLHVYVRHTARHTDTVLICQSDLPYSWNGRMVTAAGAAADSLVMIGVNGCDSVTVLDLRLKDAVRHMDTILICRGDLPYSWNGRTVTVAGAAADSVVMTGANGCDSITVLDLRLLDVIRRVDTVRICYGGLPYSWNGRMVTVAGVGADSLVIPASGTGCDSIVVLDLYVIPAPVVQISDTTACGSLFFGGRIYDHNITITDTLRTAGDCDSVYHMLRIRIFLPGLALSVAPTEVYAGEELHLRTGGDRAYRIEAWSPTHWFADQHAPEQRIPAVESGTVWVYGRDENGCVDSARADVTVLPADRRVFVPNAFSPNGDGVNDVFRPRFVMKRGYRLERFMILDRWGKTVMNAAAGTDLSWNGTYTEGKPAEVGTYFYLLDVVFPDGSREALKGEVQLLR